MSPTGPEPALAAHGNPRPLRERFPQLARESLLLKVTVGGERFLNVLPLHQHEAHRVAEGIVLVQALAQKIECRFVQRTIHPDDFYPRMDEKPGTETQGRLARDFLTCAGQRIRPARSCA